MDCISTMKFLLVSCWIRSCVKSRMGRQGDSLPLSGSRSVNCHCCIPEIPNASSSLLLPQKRERDNHSWTARALEQEDLRSSEHLCPYKQDGSDVFTTQELLYSAENEALPFRNSQSFSLPLASHFGLNLFWLNESLEWICVTFTRCLLQWSVFYLRLFHTW